MTTLLILLLQEEGGAEGFCWFIRLHLDASSTKKHSDVFPIAGFNTAPGLAEGTADWFVWKQNDVRGENVCAVARPIAQPGERQL